MRSTERVGILDGIRALFKSLTSDDFEEFDNAKLSPELLESQKRIDSMEIEHTKRAQMATETPKKLDKIEKVDAINEKMNSKKTVTKNRKIDEKNDDEREF